MMQVAMMLDRGIDLVFDDTCSWQLISMTRSYQNINCGFDQAAVTSSMMNFIVSRVVPPYYGHERKMYDHLMWEQLQTVLKLYQCNSSLKICQ